MATKEQERKALNQIQKILADLGEESYLGFAFEGCCEDALRNIDEDAAYSYKSRYESAKQAAESSRMNLEQEGIRFRATKQHLEERAQKAEEEAKRNFESALQAHQAIRDLQDEKQANLAAAADLDNTISEKDATIETMKMEIVTLKAKLYDLMTK